MPVYQADVPLEARDMLLVIQILLVRFRVGVRVGGVFDEARTVDGRPVRVYGWNYRTLGGHFEMGQMNYAQFRWSAPRMNVAQARSAEDGAWPRS